MKACAKKRKYKRHPKCANLDGLCDWNFCRCDYRIKQPKTNAKIDEYLHHREKVIKRRREIVLQQMEAGEGYWGDACNPTQRLDVVNGGLYKGEFAKRKELKAKYKRMWWISLFIFLGLVLLASLIM